MAAMRFEPVQRFISAKRIFWGYGHFKVATFVNFNSLPGIQNRAIRILDGGIVSVKKSHE